MPYKHTKLYFFFACFITLGNMPTLVHGLHCLKGQRNCFTLTSSSSHCCDCEAGKYSTNYVSCTACEAGEYSSAGSSGCTTCQNGKYSTSGSSECTDCAAGSWSHTYHHVCVSCEAGYYLDGYNVWGLQICRPCEKGEYSNLRGAPCLLCAAGQASWYGSSFCITCTAGFKPHAERGFCELCEEGTTSTTGSESCTACNAGTYSGSTDRICRNCAAGKYSTAQSTTCTECAAGYSAPAASPTCTLCTVGKFSQSGSAACVDCPRGTSNDKQGTSTCSACALGTYANTTGSSACRSCPAGEQVEDRDSTKGCEACPAGFTSADTWTACGDYAHCRNASAPSEASTEAYCEDDPRPHPRAPACPPGQYASRIQANTSYYPGYAVCDWCPDGKHTTAWTPWSSNRTDPSIVCTACSVVRKKPTCAHPQTLIEQPYGFLCDAVCSQCANGQYVANTNSTTCTACAPGKYRDTAMSVLACQDCAQDAFSNASGSSECTSCAFGKYAQTSGLSACLACSLIPGGGQHAPTLTPRPSPLVPLFTPGATAQPHTPRAKISPNQNCLALLLDHEKIRGEQSRARVLVLGARSGTQSEALTLHGAGTFVDFAVTDAAVHAVFAGADASVASMQLDEYCRPVARTEAQYPTANLSACNGSSVVFAGAEDAYLLLCHAENTSTVAGALALVTGILQPWPNASAGVPRLVQFFKDNGLNTSYAVQYANGAQARVLTQNSTGAFVHLHALASHDDRDWAYAADAVRATTGAAGGELLFLPREYPRVAEFFADGSARAWQLRGCFEYEISTDALFEQTHAHALLFARADCKAQHELVDPVQGCVSAVGAYPNAGEFYVDGDLGYLQVATCHTHQQIFPEALQELIFNNSSPLRKLCAQSIACEYGSLPAADDATQCVCRAGFAVNPETGGCEACAPGNFSDSADAPNCTLCPAAVPFSHRASTSAGSCFTAYGIRTRDPGVLGELKALARAVAPAGDTVAVHREAAALAPASMSELRAQLHKQ